MFIGCKVMWFQTTIDKKGWLTKQVTNKNIH